MSEWDAEKLKNTIVSSLADAKEAQSSTTWVLSNHDVSGRTGRPRLRVV